MVILIAVLSSLGAEDDVSSELTNAGERLPPFHPSSELGRWGCVMAHICVLEETDVSHII